MNTYYDNYYCCRPGPTGPTGPPGPISTIKGSYDTYCDLIIAHPIGQEGDSYLIGGDLYVWNKELGEYGSWENVGSLKGPFLSSYLEAVGSTQDVNRNQDIVFDTDPDYLDVVGSDITIKNDGRAFYLNSSGLYHIEWSVNIAQSDSIATVGLLENGAPASALSNSALKGCHSSGALINVSSQDVPYELRLHNFTSSITIENPVTLENTAASIRILRFADGPS